VSVGNSTVLGQKVEGWQWNDHFFQVKMDTWTMYYNAKGEPVQKYGELTPGGKLIGTVTTTYTDFNATKLDDSLFAVSGTKNCPASTSCTTAGERALLNRRRMSKLRMSSNAE